jgi:hypothetical protein
LTRAGASQVKNLIQKIYARRDREARDAARPDTFDD